MIIECDQCNTKFRLDDSRVSPNGVKVRCTKCQNVFIVTPPPPPEEVVVEEVFGAGAPFGAKEPEAPAPTEPRQESFSAPGGEKQEDSSWGVFNSEEEPDTPEDKDGVGVDIKTSAGTGEAAVPGDGEMDDGSKEAPDLSFGGPDFSSLTGPSEEAGAPVDKEPEETVDDKTEEDENPEAGAWFKAPSLKDDGFPDEGPAEGTISGEAPFADETSGEDAPASGEDDILSNEPAGGEEGGEPASLNSFDVTTPAPEDDGGEKPPFDEFDFGLDEKDEPDTEKESAGDWSAPEEASTEAGEAPGETPEETEEEVEAKEDDFALTPPPEPPAKQPENGAGEKVIPFSSGYGRNGKAAPKTAGQTAPAAPPADEENRFEDLFSRTLAKQTETGEESGGDLEFDEAVVPKESGAAPQEAAPQSYAGGKGIILAVIIFILGAGAIYFSGIIDRVARTLTSTEQGEVVEIETIRGYMAENKNFGKFFVIEAKIKNTSDEAQPIEKITGVIYDDRGKSVATRSVSPGRMVAEDDLKNLTKSDLLDRFSDSSGGVIPPQGTVPVMVPFTEMPAGMAEYGLKIIRE